MEASLEAAEKYPVHSGPTAYSGARLGVRIRQSRDRKGAVAHLRNIWSPYCSAAPKPLQSFGDNGRIDLRQGLGRPPEGISISASSPGVIFEDTIILGSTVPETLPGSPGHIRAFDVNTGKQRWIFHTIPFPGEFGYDTWPPEAYKISGGANAWAGLSVDPKLGMVFAATGSASFDFYGSNRIGNDLFAD